MGAGLNGIIFDDLEWPNWVTLKPRFQGHCILTSRISHKQCVSGTKLLKNTNRKPYTIYLMVPLSMTLGDLWRRFQGHDIFWHWIPQKPRDRAIVIIERQYEVICALSHGGISNDLEWPLKWPLTRVSRSQDTYKSNISKTVRFRDKVTKEHL